MMVKLRYKIVFEGEYEVEPCWYNTTDANEIAEEERQTAARNPSDFVVENYLEPTEVIIIPV